ncbi:MAG: TetR/AcrR family transcriptional regulator [Actinocrinis sp.]
MPIERASAERDRGGAATRARILEAAERVVRERGLARATTKEIARAAGCSEAALYKHYADKSEIVLAMITSRPGGFPQHLAGLRDQAGTLDVEATLTDLAERAVDFFARAMPVGNALLAEPDLLARYRERLAVRGSGPRTPVTRLADYLRAERDRGRIRQDADPDAAAALLLGACFHTAFLGVFLGDLAATAGERGAEVKTFARNTVSTLMLALAPRGAG